MDQNLIKSGSLAITLVVDKFISIMGKEFQSCENLKRAPLEVEKERHSFELEDDLVVE